MLQKHVVLVFIVLMTFSSFGQNEQDCVGAIPVCDGFYNQTSGYTGTGAIGNELPVDFNSCLTIDDNSVWYVFTVESDGILNFDLSPNGGDVDYDWVLVDFSTGSCDDISSDASFIVSCNSFGLIGDDGATGISSANGGTGNSNGPGDLNGPPYNSDVDVLAGETYLLYIQDWSGTSDGYTLDFSNSTASIFDDTAPEISSIEFICENEILVTMSENIVCSNLSLEDFSIDAQGTIYNPSELISSCSESSSTTSSFTLVLSDMVELPMNTPLTLLLNPDNGLLTDLCGNVIENSPPNFTYDGTLTFTSTLEDANCSESNGSILFDAVENGVDPFSYSANGTEQNDPLFDSLSSGNYELVLTDGNGCTFSESVTLDEIALVEISAGDSGSSCNFSYNLLGSSTNESVTEWSGPANISFADNTNMNTSVSSNSSGTYPITLTASQDGCDITDTIEITFSDIANPTLSTESSCGEGCNGELTINPINGITPYIIQIDGGNVAGTTNFSGICAGDHTLVISDAIGCSIDQTFTIDQLIEPTITSLSADDETCPDMCDGSIQVTAQNATSIGSPQVAFNESIDGFNNLCAGNYQIVLTSQDNCSITVQQAVITKSSMEAVLRVNPNPVELENPIVTIENLSTGNYTSSSLFIDDVLTSLDSDIIEMTLDPGENNVIVMDLIIEDQFGCIDSDRKIIQFISPLEVFIPNSFTPNNDGLNEGFKPFLNGHDASNYEFTIFNRWGEIIFRTNDPEESWLGEVNNGTHYVSASTYSYQLKVKQRFSTNEEVYMGHINIIR